MLSEFFIKLFSEYVGCDIFGNNYYLGHGKNYLGKRRRYVIYNGIQEGSKIPPMWHSWLHYTSDIIPESGDIKNNYAWQVGYVPNLTGTNYVDLKTDLEADFQQAKRYEAWAPK